MDELINKQDIMSFNDISFITDNIIDYTDATILGMIVMPFGDDIIDVDI